MPAVFLVPVNSELDFCTISRLVLVKNRLYFSISCGSSSSVSILSIFVLRLSPYFSIIARNPFSISCLNKVSLLRISRIRSILSCKVLASSWYFANSRVASRANLISRIALACGSVKPKLFIKLVLAVVEELDFLIVSTTSSMMLMALIMPSTMCSRARNFSKS